MADICTGIALLFRRGIHSGQVQPAHHGFHRGDGGPHHHGGGLFVAGGPCGGPGQEIWSISGETLLFLILSGCATGASWLCHFKALQLGPVNQVEPIDKSSVVLTILLAFLLLGEPVDALKGAGVVLIGVGTFLMIEKKKESGGTGSRVWILYAIGSAVFASLTAILGKIGITGVDSTLGTAIRTVAVLVMAWGMVGITGKRRLLRRSSGKELFYLFLSALATARRGCAITGRCRRGPPALWCLSIK